MSSSHQSDAETAKTARATMRFLHRQLKADQFALAAAVRRRQNARHDEEITRDRVHTLIARIQREAALHPNLFR